MEKVQSCVEALIQAIKEADPYQRYTRCEEKMKEQPELKKQIDEFRVAAYHFNNDETEEDLFEKIDQFESQYHEFRKLPGVNDFLEAELDMCKMMKQINLLIQSNVGFQVPEV